VLSLLPTESNASVLLDLLTQVGAPDGERARCLCLLECVYQIPRCPCWQPVAGSHCCFPIVALLVLLQRPQHSLLSPAVHFSLLRFAEAYVSAMHCVHTQSSCPTNQATTRLQGCVDSEIHASPSYNCSMRSRVQDNRLSARFSQLLVAVRCIV
jgi:hypothetical protein